MRNNRWKRDWYYIVTTGIGIIVCAASLLLMLFLIRLVTGHSLEPVEGFFLLVPCITFTSGIILIKISRVNTAEWESEEMVEPAWVPGATKKIGIISDTHGLLRRQAVDILEDCDYLIHAGDFDTEEIFRTIKSIGPLYAAKGNNDRGQWSDSLESVVYAEICGIQFAIVHNRKELPEIQSHIDVVVFGHSHKYYCEKEEEVLWLNPGSCGKRRFHLPVTMAVMEVGEKGFRIRQHILEDAVS